MLGFISGGREDPGMVPFWEDVLLGKADVTGVTLRKKSFPSRSGKRRQSTVRKGG